MSKSPTVCVIVPVYNASKLLPDCIGSILSGIYRQIELILIDDGSTDGSGELCDGYASADCRVRVIHTDNFGTASARNTGLDHANGEYVAFVDADDVIAPDYIEHLLSLLIADDTDAVACNFVPVASDKRHLPPHVLRPRTVRSREEIMSDIAERREFYWSNTCCKLFSRSAIGDRRFPPLRWGEDGVFMFDFLMNCRGITLSDYCGYFYSDSPSGVTSTADTCIRRRLDEVALAKHKYDLSASDGELKRAFFLEYAKSVNGLAYASVLSRPTDEEKATLTRILDALSAEMLRPSPRLSPRLSILLGLYKHLRPIYFFAACLHRFMKSLGRLRAKKLLASLIPTGRVILLESYPACTDSVNAVFLELLRQKINEKYSIYWLSSEHKFPYSHIPRVHAIGTGTPLSRVRLWLVKARARVIVSGNRALPKQKDGQYSLFIAHGAAIKRMRSYSLPDGIDEMIVLSEPLRISDAIAHGFSPSRTLALGLPRNDELSLPPIDTHAIFPDADFDRLVYWLPTYRRHRVTGKTVSSVSLPLVGSKSDAELINEAAKTSRTLVIVKPHFADTLRPSCCENLSNLRFISDDFLIGHEIGNYALLRSADALITDYSSVYFDFLVLDRPIALIWEDLDEYSAREGIGIGLDFMSAGEKIYTVPGLSEFLRHLAAENDPLKKERQKLTEALHPKRKSSATKSVTEHIIKHLAD